MKDLEPFARRKYCGRGHMPQLFALAKDALVGSDEISNVFASLEYVLCVSSVLLRLPVPGKDGMNLGFSGNFVCVERSLNGVDHACGFALYVRGCIRMVNFLLVRVSQNEIDLSVVPQSPDLLRGVIFRCVLGIECA
ncbi:MAG: hypothetical protein AB1641_10120 [Thermodesulfobacteriota bacterium]